MARPGVREGAAGKDPCLPQTLKNQSLVAILKVWELGRHKSLMPAQGCCKRTIKHVRTTIRARKVSAGPILLGQHRGLVSDPN